MLAWLTDKLRCMYIQCTSCKKVESQYCCWITTVRVQNLQQDNYGYSCCKVSSHKSACCVKLPDTKNYTVETIRVIKYTHGRLIQLCWLIVLLETDRAKKVPNADEAKSLLLRNNCVWHNITDAQCLRVWSSRLCISAWDRNPQFNPNPQPTGWVKKVSCWF